MCLLILNEEGNRFAAFHFISSSKRGVEILELTLFRQFCLVTQPSNFCRSCKDQSFASNGSFLRLVGPPSFKFMTLQECNTVMIKLDSTTLISQRSSPFIAHLLFSLIHLSLLRVLLNRTLRLK